MTVKEELSELTDQQYILNQRAKQLTIDVLTKENAFDEESAHCFDVDNDDVPYLKIDGRHGPLEVTISKIWYDEDSNCLVGIFNEVNTFTQDSWEQNLGELSEIPDYADILWFILLEAEE